MHAKAANCPYSCIPAIEYLQVDAHDIQRLYNMAKTVMLPMLCDYGKCAA